jgi:hypothetical protein
MHGARLEEIGINIDWGRKSETSLIASRNGSAW